MPTPTTDVLKNRGRSNSFSRTALDSSHRKSVLIQDKTSSLNKAAMAEHSKSALCLKIAANSIFEYVSGWCGHGFETHSQPFLLTYPELM